MLRSSTSEEVINHFGALFLDLDGVVYRSGRPVERAVNALNTAHERGIELRFLTNNASRTPQSVAHILSEFGLKVTADMVVTSAMAVAALMAREFDTGSPIYVVGHDGLEQALSDVGLVPTRNSSVEVAAVVQGFSPDTSWRDLSAVGSLISRGTPWFASNTDATVPIANGLAPGNGAFVQVLRELTGKTPQVAGKPQPALFASALGSVDGTPLMVGDRLDTDIQGAVGVGIESAWVATGVHRVQDVINCDLNQRPHFLLADLAGLLRPQPNVDISGSRSQCGRAVASMAGNAVEILEKGATPEEELRAMTELVWRIRDVDGVTGRVNARLSS